MAKGIMSIKRGMAVLMSACMIFGMTPIQARAEENDSEIAVQANDSAGKTEQQSTDEEECKHENVEITFNSNGFGNCPKCNATVYQPAVETTDKYDIDDDGTKDTVYEISNAGQLYWFADKVNNDNATYGSANAVLTEDIVVNENLLDSLDYDADGKVTNGERFIGWTRIGWSGWVGEEFLNNPYTGTFDGQNHTVSGLYFNDAGKYNVGLFGFVYNDGSVSNVGVVDSCFYCYGDVGGVCGSSYGTISNCYNTGRVSGNDANVGGVCGYCWGSGTIESYCYYLDTCAADGTTFNINRGKKQDRIPVRQR